jgi:hypothetical protein
MQIHSLSLILVACLAIGSHAQAASAPEDNAAVKLPRKLTDNHRMAFHNDHQATAQLFLTAYDGLASQGPVTYSVVRNYARQAISAAKGQAPAYPIESYLMLFDHNIDGEVTREEILNGLFFKVTISTRKTPRNSREVSGDGHAR